MKHVCDMYALEKEARGEGWRLIAGGDEAGRGPWAGPVFAAFAILPDPCPIDGLNDSKQLSRDERRRLFEAIKAEALGYGIGRAEPDEIDRYNILEATRLAFRRAFDAMKPVPDFVLLDYIKLPWLRLPHRAYAKGDALSASIAAASILAKEARDLVMEEFDRQYPGYGFAKHMGYGTAQHHEALQRLGPCPIHRRSFKPVKALLPSTEFRNATLF
ncbi:MAG TPA: ribonuclease HII [Candidatus Ozemobacteraceae bacterium]|nr:ribonuclease HII [Candidatus Ozemobacteraceae bacterium]